MINQMLLEQFQRNLHAYARTIRTLSPEQFLSKMDGWSPRDMTAHLIGWNRAYVRSTDALRRGELPEVLIDPGEDFSKVNAGFVAEYDSTDAQHLLRELELSFQELARHYYTLDPADWTTDFGVRFGSNLITIDKWIGFLIEDYDNHRRQIEAWRTASAA